MRYTVTTYDDRGTPVAPRLVDLPTLRALLAEAADTGQRLHIRPRTRAAHPAPSASEEPR